MRLLKNAAVFAALIILGIVLMMVGWAVPINANVNSAILILGIFSMGGAIIFALKKVIQSYSD